MMIFNYLLLIVGFALLIKGADWLVDGASSIAKKLNISAIVIGLTVVAFGTSAPELVVNILASAKGTTDLAIGNILGSNIANILLILGISAAIFPLTIKKNTVYKEIPLTILAVLILGFMVNDQFLDHTKASVLSRGDGFILTVFFALFLYYTYSISKNKSEDESKSIKEYKTGLSWLMLIGGIIGLTLGGKWIVDSAVSIANSLGASEALIGLTIVAVGTSLPELATSGVAAYKKHTDIAVGNIVGSNIFNIFWVLGLSAIIKPLPFSPALNFDILVVGVASVMLLLSLYIGRRHVLQRREAVLFLLLYIAYIVFLIYRG